MLNKNKLGQNLNYTIFARFKMRLSAEFAEHLKWVKMDAVSNIIRSTHLVAGFVWLALLLGNAFVCAWLIKDTVLQYARHEVSTTIRYLTEQQSVFPTFVICNANVFGSELASTLLSQANISMARRMQLGTVSGNYFAYTDVQAYLNRTRGYLLTDAEKRQLSPLEDFMMSCVFQGIPCNASAFEFIFQPYLLACYRFNGKGDTKLSVSGMTTRMTLQFYTGLPDTLDTTYSRGVYVMLLNSSESPYNYAISPYMITPGSGMSIIPYRQFFTQIPTPYSDCNVNDDNELADADELHDRSLFDKVKFVYYLILNCNLCLI